MKKFAVIQCFLLLFTMVFSTGGPGEEVIVNPAKPLTKQPGRTILLTEAMRIEEKDSDETYFFRFPRNIKTGHDGSIFVIDREQLLKFNTSGIFQKNFYKKGQGPFEIISISNYLVQKDILIIHDSAQNKVLFLNHKTGDKIKEFRLYTTAFDKLFNYYNSRIYLLRKEPADTRGKLEITDVEMSVLSISNDGKQVEKKISFPLKHLVIKSGEHFSVMGRSKFLSSLLPGGLAYISHTPKYEIKQYDFGKNIVARRFSRQYNRVKVTPETKKYAPGGNVDQISIGDGSFHKVPVAKYHLDIQKLFYYKGKLWVVTSTVIGKSLLLVDVYDEAGKYVDNLYLKCPESVSPYQVKWWLNIIDGDFLYAVEEDDEGHKILKKYKISMGTQYGKE